jgi:hypothetical protein
MKPFLLLFVLLFVLSTHAQEHAPTVDVCRADAAVWARDLPLFKNLSAHELMSRAGEMSDCQTVDGVKEQDVPSLIRYIGYQHLEAFYRSQGEYRAVNFIIRHGLWKQFEKEDTTDNR